MLPKATAFPESRLSFRPVLGDQSDPGPPQRQVTVGKAFEGARPTATGKVLTVLLAFAPDGRPRGVSDLARRTGLSKSTVHRMLCALVAFGLVERHEERYRPGPGLAELARWVPEEAPQRVYREGLLPVMRRLAVQTRSTAGFSVLSGTDTRCVLASDGSVTPEEPPDDLKREPLYRTASGKVLLAFSDEAFQESVLASVRPFGPARVASLLVLRAELARVRKHEIAAAKYEFAVSTASVAAPVMGPGRKVIGAVSVESVLPWSVVVGMVPDVRRAAAEASAAVARCHQRRDGG